MESVITKLEAAVQLERFEDMRAEVNTLREGFMSKLREKNKALAQEHKDAGGDPNEFELPKEPLFDRYKELLDVFNQKRAEYKQQKEAERKQREVILQEKLAAQKVLLTELRAVVTNLGSDINIAFDQFNPIQEKWKAISLSRADRDREEVKQVHIDYNHQVGLFFHHINMLKELRDLDHERNLEAKEQVLNKITAIADEENMRKLETSMKQYQTDWKAIGPVPMNKRDEVNKRFMDLADQIYGRIQEFYDERRQTLNANLKEKIALCEQVNAINALDTVIHKEWQAQTEQIIALQETWKKVGFSDENETIWQVFRNACDQFFANKRHFYETLDERRQENSVKKEAFCEQAEEVMNSTDWKKTTEFLIKLQKDWKNTGAALQKDENVLWNRFRQACDHFFQAKKAFFATLGERENENLVHKEALIKELEAFGPTENVGKDFETLKEFSKRFNAIGFVPLKEKDRIYQTFNKTLDKAYDTLKASREDKFQARYQSRVRTMMDTDGGERMMRREQNTVQDKIARIQDEIKQYEHNLGFFSMGNKKSNKPNPLQKQVEDKIAKLKGQVQDLRKQLSIMNREMLAKKEAAVAPKAEATTTVEATEATVVEEATAE